MEQRVEQPCADKTTRVKPRCNEKRSILVNIRSRLLAEILEEYRYCDRPQMHAQTQTRSGKSEQEAHAYLDLTSSHHCSPKSISASTHSPFRMLLGCEFSSALLTFADSTCSPPRMSICCTTHGASKAYHQR